MSPNGFVLPVEGTNPGGYVVQTPCGNRAVLSSGKPLAGATVVLDPGHGGDETGAVGPNGLRESVLNLAVVQQARAALEGAGVSVIMIRSMDVRVVLSTRSQLVERLRPQAFVSVHHNSTPDGPHAGDMENIEVGSDGTGKAEIVNKQVAFADGPNSLFHEGGTAIVIHASPDDNMTDPAGNAGARIACGVITK